MTNLTPEEPVRAIQAAFMQFDRRAEKVSQEILNRTFVDAEPLFIQLSSRNHQILYGRRGTGKTHALKYLAEKINEAGGIPIYIDLRVVGSNGAIYTDMNRSFSERATRLVTDVLAALENELMQLAIGKIDGAPNPEQITIRIDDLSEAVRKVVVRSTMETETSKASEDHVKSEVGASISLGDKGGSLQGRLTSAASEKSNVQHRTKETGQVYTSVDFGSLQVALTGLLEVLGSPEIWLLVDEWSEIPIDLQPYLADLFRRTVLPQKNITVKIAAIEHRSRFAEWQVTRQYTGIEIGADVTADINLDDFVVYDVDQKRATAFFRNLIFKHYSVSDRADVNINTPEKLIAAAFTQVTAFQEFVRAIEGVPRDALNLAALMARHAYGRKISVEDVRKAAREWYQQDKMSATKGNPALAEVLSFIIDEVIEKRRTRAFLFPSGTSMSVIDQLYDSRLLHLLKKSISSNEEPGKRYDVYKIDYGCYVDLVSTSKSPQALLIADDGSYVDVPPDDYRSIRRAILQPAELRGLLGNSSIDG